MERPEVRKVTREKRLLTTLVELDEFLLAEAWHYTHEHYGYVARTLLKWWREGLLERYNFTTHSWVKGFIFSTVPGSMGHHAKYRWLEDRVDDGHLIGGLE